MRLWFNIFRTEELGYLGQLWQALQQKYNDKRRYCEPGERDLYSREVADVSNLICELEKAYEVTKSEATVHMQNLISSGSYYEADTIRQRILRGLQPIVLPEDATLLELKNAVSVYEKLSDFLATEKYQEKLALITLTAPKMPNDLEAAKVVAKLIEIYELSKIRSPRIAKRLKLDPKSCAKASPILHRTALLNNKTILLAVTSRGIRISEIFDCGGRTPVHIAAQANAIDALSFFKDGHYPWLLDVDLFGRTPLVTVARSGSLEAFEFLLKVYFECVNSAMLLNGCAQALQVASQLSHQGIVRILLRRFTSTEFQSHNDSLGKALFLASVGNHPELVMILLEAGASVNSSTRAHIYNPLRGASKYGNVAIVHILLGRVVKGGNLPDTSIIKSSLHLASLGGHLQTVRLLLDAGAKKLNRYEYENILKMASACGHLEVVRLLPEASDFTTSPLDESDSALLRWASEWGNQEGIRALFDRGIHHNATGGDNAYGRPYCKSNEGPIDYERETAFGLASKQGYLDVVKLLFDRNTSISYITALKDALKSCKPELAKMIFEYGAGASAWSSITAAIQGAARIGHHEIVCWLLQKVAAIKLTLDAREKWAMDAGGWTRYRGVEALQTAAGGGHRENVRSLLEVGDYTNEISRLNLALCSAATSGHFEIPNLEWLGDPQ